MAAAHPHNADRYTLEIEKGIVKFALTETMAGHISQSLIPVPEFLSRTCLMFSNVTTGVVKINLANRVVRAWVWLFQKRL